MEKEQLIYPLSALVSYLRIENLLHGKKAPICRLLTLAELSVFLSASLLSPSGNVFWDEGGKDNQAFEAGEAQEKKEEDPSAEEPTG